MREASIVGLFIAAVVLLWLVSSWERQDWLDKCVADGNKAYECEERYSAAHPPAPQVHVHTSNKDPIPWVP